MKSDFENSNPSSGFGFFSDAEPPAHIKELIRVEAISAQAANDLNHLQVNALADPNIRQQFLDGRLPLQLVDVPSVMQYVAKGSISLSDAENLSRHARFSLNSQHVRELIDAGVISFDEALDLTFAQCSALRNQDIQERLISGSLPLNLVDIPIVAIYVEKGLISPERAASLNPLERENFQAHHVIALVDEGVITIDMAISLTEKIRNILDDGAIIQLLAGRKLSSELLATPYLQPYVDDGFMTLEQACGLSADEIGNLRMPHVRELIDSNIVTFDQALKLSALQLNALHDPDVKQRVISGELDVRLVDIPFIGDWIAKGIVTMDRVLNLSERDRRVLCGGTGYIRKLITDDFISFDTAVGLTTRQAIVLESPATRERLEPVDVGTRKRLRSGDMTIEEFLGPISSKDIFTRHARPRDADELQPDNAQIGPKSQ